MQKNIAQIRVHKRRSIHEAHFCSKFKNKLKTLPASAAKQTKNKPKKKFKLIKETKIRADSKR